MSEERPTSESAFSHRAAARELTDNPDKVLEFFDPIASIIGSRAEQASWLAENWETLHEQAHVLEGALIGDMIDRGMFQTAINRSALEAARQEVLGRRLQSPLDLSTIIQENLEQIAEDELAASRSSELAPVVFQLDCLNSLMRQDTEDVVTDNVKTGLRACSVVIRPATRKLLQEDPGLTGADIAEALRHSPKLVTVVGRLSNRRASSLVRSTIFISDKALEVKKTDTHQSVTFRHPVAESPRGPKGVLFFGQPLRGRKPGGQIGPAEMRELGCPALPGIPQLWRGFIDLAEATGVIERERRKALRRQRLSRR